MSLNAMLDDLPKRCDRGTKKNARGMLETWRGYKLHIDTADCGVPISAILTSESVHDSQSLPRTPIRGRHPPGHHDRRARREPLRPHGRRL